MSIELEYSRQSQFRLFLLERVAKIKNAKVEMICQTESLIKIISQLNNQAIYKLEIIMEFYYEILSQTKFLKDQMQIIEEIESKEILIEVGSIEKIIKESENFFYRDLVKFQERDQLNSKMIEEIGKTDDEERKKHEDNLEASKEYLEKFDSINLSARINSIQPIMYTSDQGWTIDACNKLIKEILVSNDGQYYFVCIPYIDWQGKN